MYPDQERKTGRQKESEYEGGSDDENHGGRRRKCVTIFLEEQGPTVSFRDIQRPTVLNPLYRGSLVSTMVHEVRCRSLGKTGVSTVLEGLLLSSTTPPLPLTGDPSGVVYGNGTGEGGDQEKDDRSRRERCDRGGRRSQGGADVLVRGHRLREE